MEALTEEILIIPLISSLVVGLAMKSLPDRASRFAGILERAHPLVANHGDGKTRLLGAITRRMMCTDMGGPVNKAAYAFWRRWSPRVRKLTRRWRRSWPQVWYRR